MRSGKTDGVQLGSTATKRSPRKLRAFTLVELLLVITIISTLATTVLFALYGVAEDAKEKRTRTQINKINQLLLDRWESYRTRRIPIRIPPELPPKDRALVRLYAIRDLMRMELPDRLTDLTFGPTPIPLNGNTVRPMAAPALWKRYRRRAGFDPTRIPQPTTVPVEFPLASDLIADTNPTTNWTTANQGSECLYLILEGIQDGDGTALDFFRDSEIGDTDGDLHPEILDSWGRPIQFLRWAPGYISELQVGNAAVAPDPFDPLRVDPRWLNSNPQDDPFAMFPLVYSAGRDGVGDIASDVGSGVLFAYSVTQPPNDPYAVLPTNDGIRAGQSIPGENGTYEDGDNISNHLLEAN